MHPQRMTDTKDDMPGAARSLIRLTDPTRGCKAEQRARAWISRFQNGICVEGYPAGPATPRHTSLSKS